MKQRPPTAEEIAVSAQTVATADRLLRITGGECAIVIVVQGDNVVGGIRMRSDALQVRTPEQWAPTLAHELRAFAAEIERGGGAMLRAALQRMPS